MNGRAFPLNGGGREQSRYPICDAGGPDHGEKEEARKGRDPPLPAVKSSAQICFGASSSPSISTFSSARVALRSA